MLSPVVQDGLTGDCMSYVSRLPAWVRPVIQVTVAPTSPVADAGDAEECAVTSHNSRSVTADVIQFVITPDQFDAVRSFRIDTTRYLPTYLIHSSLHLSVVWRCSLLMKHRDTVGRSL
jgi:hypothetical protein